MRTADGTSSASVAVIVVTWNGADRLPSCLDPLLAQRQLTSRDIAVVVVDNGSTDQTPTLLSERYPSVGVVRLDANVGFGGGVCAGFNRTSAPIVVLLNDDAVPEPGFVEAIVRPFEAADSARLAAVTGHVVLARRYSPARDRRPGQLVDAEGHRWEPDENGIELLNSTGNIVSRSGNGMDRDWLVPTGGPPPPRDVFGFCGAAAAVSRAAWDDVSGFDTSLFMYYEDSDLSWRLRRRGWRIEYAPDAVVRHLHATSSDVGSALFREYNERNRLLVAVRNAPWPVVARAFARTGVRAARDLRDPVGRAIHRRVATAVVRRLPGLLSQRRAIDRAALVSRGAVARYLVADPRRG